MRQSSMLKPPKIEEQIVPESILDDFFERDDNNLSNFKDVFRIKDGGNDQGEGVMSSTYDGINWDHLIEWDNFSANEEDQDSGICDPDKSENIESSMVNSIGNVKRENNEIWEQNEDQDHDNKMCLNLSLNYQEVMNAWSDRGPCWENDLVHSTSDNNYRGEVPVMNDARIARAAKVLRYKRKRKNRLSSGKIRYEVRKINADKRARFKGRFVKKGS